MYKALYRAYRPEVFEQLLGQEHIVRILRNQIKADTISHAYLFCGTRGTGKTTTARLLAKGLNCLSEGERPCGECSSCQAIKNGSFVDVIEIDGASARGIDQVRELRESVNYPPFVGRKKVYIIDEVHMLTTEAFNAILKTLEEPPEYAVFILATTEVQKLPATILSRCIRLDFRRVPERVIAQGMRQICSDMGIDVTDGALRIIAANADGSVRDGLSILDQCITGSEGRVDVPDVLEYIGASGEAALLELTEYVSRGRTADAIKLLADLMENGREAKQLMSDWIQHYRNLLMARFIKDPEKVIDLSVENIEKIKEQAAMMDPEEISRGIMELSKTMNESKWSPKPKILLELCIVNLSSRGEFPKARPAARQEMKEAPRTDRREEANPEMKEAPRTERKEEARPEIKEADREERGEEKQDENRDEKPGSSLPEQEEQSAGQPYDGEIDLLDLWDKVFTDGSSSMSSMYIIRSNSMLTSMDDNTFTLTVASEINKSHIEKNRRIIEDLMENRTGKRRIMNIELDNGDKKEMTVEETAAKASSLIGIPVDIE